MSREDVELFCIDHLLMVDIIATEEALIFDVSIVLTILLVSSFMYTLKKKQNVVSNRNHAGSHSR
jgi:hypothetical protein